MPLSSSQAAPFKSDPALRSMFEARKRVFVDLLKWDVPVLDGRFEVDQFDTPDAVYLVLADESANHRASARLLRTDRSHILGQLFPSLCEGMIPSGLQTREITRFCIDPALCRTERRRTRNELVSALVDHALRWNITDYTAVANMPWFRQIARFGWKCRALGPPRLIGTEMLIALHIEIDDQTTGQLKGNGIYSSPRYQFTEMGARQ
jgi:N-acyl-L-homoserine lactone synthetase